LRIEGQQLVGEGTGLLLQYLMISLFGVVIDVVSGCELVEGTRGGIVLPRGTSCAKKEEEK